MSEILQVQTRTLRNGGTEFGKSHDGIDRALTSAERDHEHLQETWAGSAADVMRERWDDTVPHIAKQASALLDYARLLASSADAYDDTETTSVSNIQSSGDGSPLEI